jgi:hypothetical protein
MGLDKDVRAALCEAAVSLCHEIKYDNAGTVEFLYDQDTREWFFIDMNPRIQVEHTVTEVITGVDLVRSQILIADGKPMHGDEVGIPAQEDIPRNGLAVQCRITTEDPENKFQPDYGRILTYRSAGGFGVRLDGGMGYAGSVVTPFYDSLLVKLTASGPTFAAALQRMDRALREFRIRGVKTNIPFLENVIHHEEFTSGRATTTLIDTTPELFNLKTKRDRATKILNFLGDVTVNGNPQAKNFVPKESLQPARIPAFDRKQTPPKGTRQLLLELGPKKFAEWTLKQKQLLITDTTFRDAHQSLFATRMRTYDMLAVADAVARRTPNLYSMEMWGGATFDTALRFLHEDPWLRLRALRERIPNICFQMLFRGSNARQRRRRVRQARGGGGHGYFPRVRLAELSAEPRSRDGGGERNARRLRSRDLLHRQHPRPGARQILAEVLCEAREAIGKDGRARSRHQGHGRPMQTGGGACVGEGAQVGDRYSDSFPHARYERHCRRVCFVRRRCGRGHRRPRHRFDERLDEPAELEFRRRRAAIHQARHRSGFGSVQRVRRLLGTRPHLLRAVRHVAQGGQRGGLSARDARRPVHESQGTGVGDGSGASLAGNRPHLC